MSIHAHVSREDVYQDNSVIPEAWQSFLEKVEIVTQVEKGCGECRRTFWTLFEVMNIECTRVNWWDVEKSAARDGDLLILSVKSNCSI